MTRIQVRRGTSSQWRSKNPVLASGEPGLETDTGFFKLGDGRRTWSKLPYFQDTQAQSAADARGLSVLSYGALGDGQTDDTVALASAITDAARSGRAIWFPAGIYRVTRPLPPIDSFVRLWGESRDPSSRSGARIHYTAPTGTLLTGRGGLDVRDLTIMGTAPAEQVTTSTAVLFAGGAGSLLLNCTVNGFGTNVALSGAHLVTLRDNVLVNAKTWNVHIANAQTPDGGDHLLEGNLLDTDAAAGWTAAAAIRIESSGGSRVIGNKILRHLRQIDVAPTDGAHCTVLAVTANSIQQGGGAEQIRLAAPGTGSYSHIVITGNEMAAQAGGGTATANVLVGQGVSNVTISGNTFAGPATPATGAAVRVAAGASGVMVSGNTVATWPAGVVAEKGGAVTATANRFDGVGVPVSEGPGPSYVTHDHRRTVTAGASYTRAWQVDLSPTSGCTLEADFTGRAGSTPVVARASRLATRAADAVTLVPAGDDVATSAAVVLDLDTSVPGSVVVQVRAGGQAEVTGQVSLRVRGDAVTVRRA